MNDAHDRVLDSAVITTGAIGPSSFCLFMPLVIAAAIDRGLDSQQPIEPEQTGSVLDAGRHRQQRNSFGTASDPKTPPELLFGGRCVA